MADIQFRFASKTFGSHRVLMPAYLEFRRGTVTALLGPSGIGKTTLLRLIAGLDRDDEGSKAKDHVIGMVFQEPRLLPWETVRRNVELVGPVKDWLDRVGLADKADLYPRQLSLGMARRAALARALAADPQLLILDEPFASLDEDTCTDMRRVIAEATGDASVLMVSHLPEDAATLADQVLFLQGRPATLSTPLKLSIPRDDRTPSIIIDYAARIRARA